MSIIIVAIFTSFFAWLWFGFYEKLRSTYNFEGEFTTRIVAATHAVVVVVLAYFSLKYGPDPLTEPGEPNTNLQILTMMVSLGYFLYDFIWCVKFQPDIKLILLHHLASICSISFILTCGTSGAAAIGGLGSMEITNPLLQARWFLRTYNKRDTILFQVVEYSFFALFLTVRLGYGSYLLFAVLASDKTYYTTKACCILMYIVSLMFVNSIIKFVIKQLNTRDRIEEDVKLS